MVKLAEDLSPEMKTLTFYQADGILFQAPGAEQLAHKIAQELLEADLTARTVNAVLYYAWYEVVCTGKLKNTPDRPRFGCPT